jgi:hypothetical protein
MYAVVREGTVDLAKLAEHQPNVEELRRLRAQQPGYRGSLTIDAGDGRRVVVILWETEEHREAAGTVMEPAAARLLGPLRTNPSEPERTLARGPVVHVDLPQG